MLISLQTYTGIEYSLAYYLQWYLPMVFIFNVFFTSIKLHNPFMLLGPLEIDFKKHKKIKYT